MNTTTYVAGERALVNRLQPGQRLRLVGDETERSFRADRIDVIEEASPGDSESPSNDLGADEKWVDAAGGGARASGASELPAAESTEPQSTPMSTQTGRPNRFKFDIDNAGAASHNDGYSDHFPIVSTIETTGD